MGADVFATKCGVHNIVVPRHQSCPVCVSAKRTQLHAANLAHMPRYLFDQQLDVRADATGLPKPVRSFMKAPETITAQFTVAAMNVVPYATPTAPTVPRTYKPNMRSRDWNGHYDLNATTKTLYGHIETAPELLEQWFNLQQCIEQRTTTVESVAYTLWDSGTSKDGLLHARTLTKVRDQFVARFVYLYKHEQRVCDLTGMTEPEKPKPLTAEASLVDCLYNYLVTNTKELSQKRTLLESELSKPTCTTKANLAERFRDLAIATARAYENERMYDWKRINANTVYELQERLADEFLLGLCQ